MSVLEIPSSFKLVEALTHTANIALGLSIFIGVYISRLDSLSDTQNVGGSSPPAPTMFLSKRNSVG